MKRFCQILVGLTFITTVALMVGIYSEDHTVNYGHTSPLGARKKISSTRCKTAQSKEIPPLDVHASGLINFNDLPENVRTHPDKLYVINLLDDNIYYYKNRCLRFYGLGYTPKTLGTLLFQHKPIKAFYKSILRLIYRPPSLKEMKEHPELLQTEAQILKGMGAHYFSPLKGNDNWLKDQHYMEDVIKFFESLPKDAILYIHCAHGKGRTTTFLVLYDIFLHRKNLTLQQIADRHYCLGREDVMDTQLWDGGSWTEEALQARKNLVERFYQYMTSQDAYPEKPWPQWNDEQAAIGRLLSLQAETVHR